MMDISANLITTLPVENVLGECPLWRPSDQTLWWTDIEAKSLFRYAWEAEQIQQWPLERRLASFAFVDGSDDELLCAFDDGIALYTPGTGATAWLVEPGCLPEGVRFNDGRVAPGQAFWISSMDEAGQTPPRGSLFILRGRTLERVRDDVAIGNSLSWSPDGDVVYFADSPTGLIERAELTRAGRPGPFGPFARVPAGIHPDGAAVDRHGNLWSALWGAGEVAVFDPDGRQIARLAVPAMQVTCPCFCGPDLEHVAVTSARVGLSEAELQEYPQSGALFVYETTSQGRAPVRWTAAERKEAEL